MGLFPYSKTFVVNVAMPAGRTPFSGGPHHWTRRLFEAEVDAWTNLASTDAGMGASQVGIEDLAGYFTSTTVEGALAELAAGGGGGGIGGTIAATQVAYGSALNTIAGSATFTYDSVNNVLALDQGVNLSGILVRDVPVVVSSDLQAGALILNSSTEGATLSGVGVFLEMRYDTAVGQIPTIRTIDETTAPAPLELTIGELRVNNSTGNSGDTLTSQGGGSAPIWQNPALTSTAYYGQFISNADQPLVANTPYVVQYSSATASNGVSLNNDAITGDPTNLEVLIDGIYEVSVSLQVLHTGGGTITLTFWLRVDGVDVPSSASSIEMGNNNNRTLPFAPIILNLTAGQYVEWVVMTSGAPTSLEQFANVVGPPAVPEIPSVIANLKRIGA